MSIIQKALWGVYCVLLLCGVTHAADRGLAVDPLDSLRPILNEELLAEFLEWLSVNEISKVPYLRVDSARPYIIEQLVDSVLTGLPTVAQATVMADRIIDKLYVKGRTESCQAAIDYVIWQEIERYEREQLLVELYQ